jgi:hypothetical protein
MTAKDCAGDCLSIWARPLRVRQRASKSCLRDGSRHFFRAIGDADVYTPRRGFKSLVAIKNDALERVRMGKVGTSWSLPRLGKPFDAASYLVDETYKLRLESLLETRN